MEIAYVELESFPGVKLFRCEPLHATLMVEACAKNFLAKKYPACATGCPIGQQHAGEQAPEVVAAIADKVKRKEISPIRVDLQLYCIRCMRSGMNAERFLGRFRLIRDHTICVNCYNRELEVHKGVNAKGAKPKKWAALLKHTAIKLKRVDQVEIVDIGLTSGPLEIFGLAQRRYPDWTLVRAVFDGKRISGKKIKRARKRYIARAYRCDDGASMRARATGHAHRRAPVFITDGRTLYG
ncbi:hypothetical protein GCM10027093_08940 [Paraburkholderia jirisanensis]